MGSKCGVKGWLVDINVEPAQEIAGSKINLVMSFYPTTEEEFARIIGELRLMVGAGRPVTISQDLFDSTR